MATLFYWECTTNLLQWEISWHERVNAIVKFQLNYKIKIRMINGFGTDLQVLLKLNYKDVGVVALIIFAKKT